MWKIERDRRDGLIYDPIIKGYDTSFWASLTGTPAATGTPQIIRYNAATSGSYVLFEYADIEFQLLVPANPTAGDARIWGFKAPSTNNAGAVYFEITGATFQLVIYDNWGNKSTYPLTWVNGTYTNAQTKFRIRWDYDYIYVYVADTLVYSIPSSAVNGQSSGSTAAKDLPRTALPMYIKNGNADNMDVAYMLVFESAGLV